jgi:hypothetical protein
MIIMKRMVFSLKAERTPYQGRYFYIGAWTAPGLESCAALDAGAGSTYASNGVVGNRHGFCEFFAQRIGPKTRYLDMGHGGGTMIPTFETERMWARPVQLEDAEQVQRVFPRCEIVKHLGAVVPWPYGSRNRLNMPLLAGVLAIRYVPQIFT